MLLTKESVLGIVQLCSYPMNYIGNVNFSTCVYQIGYEISTQLDMTRFKKTDRIVTFCISRNPISRHCSSLKLDCSHARFAPEEH